MLEPCQTSGFDCSKRSAIADWRLEIGAVESAAFTQSPQERPRRSRVLLRNCLVLLPRLCNRACQHLLRHTEAMFQEHKEAKKQMIRAPYVQSNTEQDVSFLVQVISILLLIRLRRMLSSTPTLPEIRTVAARPARHRLQTSRYHHLQPPVLKQTIPV